MLDTLDQNIQTKQEKSTHCRITIQSAVEPTREEEIAGSRKKTNKHWGIGSIFWEFLEDAMISKKYRGIKNFEVFEGL